MGCICQMYRYRRAPFVMLDEFDASLDTVNIHKVVTVSVAVLGFWPCKNGLGYTTADLLFHSTVAHDNVLVCFCIIPYKRDNGCCLFSSLCQS